MKNDILLEYRATADQLLQLVKAVDQEQMNLIPFEGSWSAAQVLSHINKSNQSIVQALNMEARTADRQPDLRVAELKSIFLDFTTKLNSPEFILPAKGIYDCEQLIAELENSMESLLQSGRQVDLSEAILHPAFGDITKLELLHFVLYHTQRHLQQLQHIFQLLEKGYSKR